MVSALLKAIRGSAARMSEDGDNLIREKVSALPKAIRGSAARFSEDGDNLI